MKTELFTKVDTLGALLAQIAELTKMADGIKRDLKDQATLPGGNKVTEGAMFKATVISANRETVEYKKLLADLGVSEETIAKYTSTTAVFSVKVTSK